NSDILPSNTIFLDLKKKENELLVRMKPKTRYNIRLSERRGVRVGKTDMSNLDIWYDLYTQTALRNGIYLHDIDYFKTVLGVSTEIPSADVELLVAEKDGV